MITEYQNNCLLCGRPSTDVHHLCFGTYGRKLSDEDGLTMPVCRDCHHVIHNTQIGSKLSKICGQLAWEKQYCIDKHGNNAEAREQFRKRYGVSFL